MAKKKASRKKSVSKKVTSRKSAAKKPKKVVVAPAKPAPNHAVGHYAFILGVLLAILAGLLVENPINPSGKVISLVLVLLGLLVGFINITHKESYKFLVAAIALLLAGTMSLGIGSLGYDPIDQLGVTLRSIFAYIRNFVAPAVLIVSLKMIKNLAEE